MSKCSMQKKIESLSKKNEALVTTDGTPITERTWDKGVIDGYSYEALVFPEGSVYGINDGNISKLSIKDPNGKLVLNYDRGWDIKPNAKTKKIMDKILDRYNPKTKKSPLEAFMEALDSLEFKQDENFPDSPTTKTWFLPYPSEYGRVGVSAGSSKLDGTDSDLCTVSLVVEYINGSKRMHIATRERNLTENDGLQELMYTLSTYMGMARKIASLPSD